MSQEAPACRSVTASWGFPHCGMSVVCGVLLTPVLSQPCVFVRVQYLVFCACKPTTCDASSNWDLKLDANAFGVNPCISWSEKQLFVQLQQLKAEIEDASLPYPAYYLRKFHGYDGGNLDWQAACELESATASLALRIIKKDRPASSVAADMMRNSFLDTTQVIHMHDTFVLVLCGF